MFACSYTVPLLTRNILHCGQDEDDLNNVITKSFNNLLSPGLVASSSDIHRRPTRVPSNFLDLMLKGANGSFESIVSKFGWFFSWVSAVTADNCVSTLCDIGRVLQSDHSGPGASLRRECCRALLRSEEFWRGVFRVLKLGCAHLDDLETLAGTGRPISSLGDELNSDTYDLIRILWEEDDVLATKHVAGALTMIKSGFFETVEELLSAYGSRRIFPVNETRPDSK